MSIKVIYGVNFKVAHFQDVEKAKKFAKEMGTDLIIVPKKPKTNSFGRYAAKKGQVA